MLKRLIRPLVGSLIRRLRPTRVDLPLSTWRLTRDPRGVLALDGLPLDELLERWGSPLHVVDAARLDQNAADFVAVPEGATRGAEITYSFKTNPVPGVLARLHARGVGAEVISPYELWLADKIGFHPEEIIYNGPARSQGSLRLAIEREIDLININSRCEIAELSALARELGKRPRVGVRVVVPGGWGGQLGERVDTGAALRAFTEAKALPELRVIGLHAHLGFEIADSAALTDFVTKVLAFADELRQRLSLDIEVLDLGGSLACPTTRHLDPVESRLNQAFGADLLPRPRGAVIPIREAVSRVVSLVEDHYHRIGRPRPRIVLEPGRAMTSNAQMLLARVVNVQDKVDGVIHAVLDAGICVASPVPNEYHQLFVVGPPRTERRQTTRLVGPICSPADVLYPSWNLPELAPGDAIAIMDAGAYFVPFASSFSFPQPAIVMVDGGQDAILRRAETFEHMTALDGLEGDPAVGH